MEGPSTPKSPHKFITSGSQTVKSLTSRFEDLDSMEGLSLEATAEVLKHAVSDQRREIETLKAQVATKEAKIRQLEDTLLRITGSGGIALNDAFTTSSTA